MLRAMFLKSLGFVAVIAPDGYYCDGKTCRPNL